MSRRYRKKPVEIDAIYYDGGSESLVQAAAFLGEYFIDSGSNGEIFIETLEGDIRASVGDWIIKGVVGEFYPCRADIFAQTYELAT